jgi:hypothetical protein
VPTIEYSLGLRAGNWVEVRGREEILSTLDERGALDALPFMPEMLQYCGRRFQVFRTAHKTCDTICTSRSRRMTNTVHLAGLRCDGTAHGGCQAACLLFWKEAWLRRVPGPHASAPAPAAPAAVPADGRCTLESLTRATRAPGSAEESAEVLYACQATELLRASAPLGSWEPGQFVRDLVSRNVRLGDFVRYMAIAVYNRLASSLGWRPYPHVRGLAAESTPSTQLHLQPGELVAVRPKGEIMRTLNASGRNRGLWFDVEMLPHCGKTYRVQARVERIVDEKTGKMVTFSSDCIILENVVCSGFLSRDRLFCPRSIFPYWREAWLKRAP